MESHPRRANIATKCEQHKYNRQKQLPTLNITSCHKAISIFIISYCLAIINFIRNCNSDIFDAYEKNAHKIHRKHFWFLIYKYLHIFSFNYKYFWMMTNWVINGIPKYLYVRNTTYFHLEKTFI